MERLIRFRSGSTPNTFTSTFCPTLSNSLGWFRRAQEISERWTRPSAPPISTKAPKSARLMTCPVRSRPLRKDQPIAASIDLDDLGDDRFPHHLRPALVGRLPFRPPTPREAHLRGRDKPPRPAHLHDQPALVIPGDRPLEAIL